MNADADFALLRRAGRLLAGASVAALVAGVPTSPALAQLVQMRQTAGVGITPAAVAAAAARPAGMGIVRPVTRQEALDRANALRSRSDQVRAFVVSARNAALAATRTRPGDGLVANGLVPIAAIRDAIQKSLSPDAAVRGQVPGIIAGLAAARDASGIATWQNVGLPTQTTEGSRIVVGLVQTDARAIASWDRFDIGADTTLRVTQKSGGVDQPGWTLVNRVGASVAPSTILGRIEAPGTVVVLNRSGIIFGQGSQINVGSLLASSLELGAYLRVVNVAGPSGGTVPVDTVAGIGSRNLSFLQNGLFSGIDAKPTDPTLQPMLFSSQYDAALGLGTTPALEGAVEIDPGATITARSGGAIIIAAPKVSNAGVLAASDGQVSLQGGRYIGVVASSGAADSADPNVRGFIVSSFLPGVAPNFQPGSVQVPATPDNGVVINSGLVESRRGYVSLGTDFLGSVTNSGLIDATTSVSRNAKVALYGGTVTIAAPRRLADNSIAPAGGIRILPDGNGEVLPQGTADSPPNFKTSQISISATVDATLPKGVSGQFPTIVDFGAGSFIEAPGANVRIGRDPASELPTERFFPSRITLGDGATIDIGGVKGVAVDGNRNFLTIDPVKRNELRDTPTYRETTTDGSFTLNGSTLTVDIRKSGVRADGVRWVGSPLLEAGSAASQIGVTAAELLSTGGTVTLGVAPVLGAADAATAPSVQIAPTATIDISGGWLDYSAATKGASKLRTADGRLVDIADADPNDNFVAVVDGFISEQPRFGIRNVFTGALTPGVAPEPAYQEGRDAGALLVSASAADVAGRIYGNAYAGRLQIAAGDRGTRAPTGAATSLDPRLLQASRGQLPSGGYVRIGGFSVNGEGAATALPTAAITVYRGTRTGTTPWLRDILLDGDMLSAAGLSGLTLQSSGGVTFAGAGDLAGLPITGGGDVALGLAPGGVLRVDAGRSILFDGTIEAAGGRIAARTYELGNFVANETPSLATLVAEGSPFDGGDDLKSLYAAGEALPARTFDIVVNGSLSVAGLWTNSLTDSDLVGGAGFLDGGSISLAVAPKVLVRRGSGQAGLTDVAADLSGRIEIASAARIDVSAGGYVRSDQSFDLSGHGGDLRLANETVYASLTQTRLRTGSEAVGTADYPINASSQSVDFTPLPAAADDNGVTPQLMPEVRRAAVVFDENSLIGFGFTGGGSFELVSPDIRFNSAFDAGAPGASYVSLDFLQRTGFGTLSLTSYRSRFANDIFSNDRRGVSAFLDTTTFRIGAGDRLDLTQAELPRFLSQAQSDLLLALGSGANVTDALRPTVAGGRFTAPAAVFDRHAATLNFGGLTELVVAAGGSIETAAPGATITTAKLLNAGTIRLPGGHIVQQDRLAPFLGDRRLQVRAVENGGTGLAAAFGPADANGRFDENAINPQLGVSSRSFLTADSNDYAVVFAGALDLGEGVRLAAGSVTDLSGGPAIYDPRAPIVRGGQLRLGRLPGGGSLSTAAATAADGTGQGTLFDVPTYGVSRTRDTINNGQPLLGVTYARSFAADAGAVLDLSGSTGVFDQAVAGGGYAGVTEWSNGGTLSVLGGGRLTAGVVRARGGTAAAIGGTLEWLRPTLAATGGAGVINDILGADAITAAGFDTLITRGGFTVSGTLDLRLGKALLITSAPSTIGTSTAARISPEAQIRIGATDGADALISAPYIRSESRIGYAALGTTTSLGDGRLRLEAGASGLDLAGAILFDATLADVRLGSAGDIRLIGVNDVPATALPELNGEVVSYGNLTFDAVRVYATTGTGNLQRSLEQLRLGNSLTAFPYQITALTTRIGTAAPVTRSITFLGRDGDRSVPLSAGSYLRVQASTIVQNGALYAPLGVLELGSNSTSASLLGAGIVPASNNHVGRAVVTDTLRFGAGSLTSVSASGARIPYGTTTDLTELFFTPTANSALTVLPYGELRLAGGNIDFAGTSARIDGRGSADPLTTFAFEFVSGVGGSRDVLSRFNSDVFSSNNYDAATGQGTQFADGRQVFALLPVASAGSIALSDPIYSADYGSAGPVDLYGAAAGRTVHLDAAPGFAGGDYLLLPGHYALLPGALRLVENVEALAPAPDQGQVLRDGSFVVGGNYATAGTGFAEATRRSFTVQNAATFRTFSRIETTGGGAAITAAAIAGNRATPRLALDAARVVLAPLQSLTGTGFFDTAAAAGGRGAEVDIQGRNIIIAADGTPATPGALTLTTGTLAGLNANSLFIGGDRRVNSDGTTSLRVTATDLTVRAGVTLQAPELLLAVGAISVGSGTPTLRIEDGATLRASGTLLDTGTGDYVVNSRVGTGSSDFDQTGIGATLRVANGPERLVRRLGDGATANTLRPARLIIGAATLDGISVAAESSRTLTIERTGLLQGRFLALGSDSLRFGSLANSDAQLAAFGAAERLTLISTDRIQIAAGDYRFNNLVIDAPGLALQTRPSAEANGVSETVTIAADTVSLKNGSDITRTPCGAPLLACGSTANRLFINAGEIVFGDGDFGTFGFDGTVAVTAARGAYYEGVGSFDTNQTFLTLSTPFLIDRVNSTRTAQTPPDFSLLTGSQLVINTAGATPGAAPTGDRAPGARLRLGDDDRALAGLTVDGTALTATAGVIAATATRDIRVTGAARLAATGYSRTFGDNVDRYTVSAAGGTISLLSRAGSIALGSATLVDVDNGVAGAGTLRFLASAGSVALGGGLNTATGTRTASFILDSGQTAFDLAGFVAAHGAGFQGRIDVRTGTGDLALADNQLLRATAVRLVADGGALTIAGTIDTSGANVAGLSADAARKAAVDGGAIDLFGHTGVALVGDARLDTHTTGYADSDTRTASAGDITIGIGSEAARISISADAVIDLGARRTQAATAAGGSGNRLVADLTKNASTLVGETVYRFVEADKGGALLLRAPVIGADGNQVGIDLPTVSVVRGARSQTIEGVRRYDLDALAAAGNYTGVAFNAGINAVDLDLEFGYDDGFNLLSNAFADGGFQSVPYFIQNFRVTPTSGSLAGFDTRPGVELVSTRSVNLFTNWNLAAADVDVEAAVAAGLMVLQPALSYNLDPRYAVVPGREADLLEGSYNGRPITRFIYRVDGKASGAAPILTIRGAGNFTNQGISGIQDAGSSISDGFFLFADRTDPAYVSYQLGGQGRALLPAVTLTCAALASGDCGNVAGFFDIAAGRASYDPGSASEQGNGVSLNLAQVVAGPDVNPAPSAPYNPLGNRPSARATTVTNNRGDEVEAGDPLGSASLFPLLAGGTTTMASSSYRIVAGADVASADPLQIDRSRPADIRISGERSYEVRGLRGSDDIAESGGRSSYTNLAGTTDNRGAFALTVRVNPLASTTDTAFNAFLANRDLLASADAASLDSGLGVGTADAYTVLNWGPGQGVRSSFLRSYALRYFNTGYSPQDLADFEALAPADRDALQPGDRRLVGILQGPARAPTGIAVRLTDALAFLAWQYQGAASASTVGSELARLIVSGEVATASPTLPAPVNFGTTNDAYVGAMVRTGTGSIALAASRDVSLLRTPDPVYRRSSKDSAVPIVAQVGSNAVYSAGGRVPTGSGLTAATADGATTIAFAWNAAATTAPALDNADYVPTPLGQYLIDPAITAGGGDVAITAGRDVVGRRDVFDETYLSNSYDYTRPNVGRGAQRTPQPTPLTSLGIGNSLAEGRLGEAGQAWRVGASGGSIVAASVPSLFRSGVGALGGGDIAITAGRQVTELTVVADNSAVNADGRSGALLTPSKLAGTTPRVLVSFGDGDIRIHAGGDIVGGQVDIASGRADIAAAGAVAASDLRSGLLLAQQVVPNDLRLRLTDATIALAGRASVTFDSVTSLGADSFRSNGDMSAAAGLSVLTNGFISFSQRQVSANGTIDAVRPVLLGTQLLTTFYDAPSSQTPTFTAGLVLPGSLELAALGGDIAFGDRPLFLLPSRLGQLRLLASGDITGLDLAMSDVDPALLPGNFSVYISGGSGIGSVDISGNGVEFGFPATYSGLSERRLRNFHNERPTHEGDAEPVRIAAGGSILDAILNLPKAARISAGEDIGNVYFTGQNLAAGDVTRITAGRDIIGTLAVEDRNNARAFVRGNNFVLGGPGSLVVEAGRNLGPFLSSGSTGDGLAPYIGIRDYAGGIRTVGNRLNPWLTGGGAAITVGFGIGGGGDYVALRDTYLNPANFAALDGDLFVQIVDEAGNSRPDRSRPVLVPLLARWLRGNAPDAFAGVFGGTAYPDTDAGNAALATAAYGRADALYAAFARLDGDAATVGLRQQQFLAGDLLFNELEAPAIPTSPSYQQYIRGYRALQTLFPTSRGYTDNLAAYDLDPATVTPDHPLGVPRRRLDANGQPVVADRKLTGNADLRLATIQTVEGGAITILAPGGDLIAGSVVRLSEQTSRRDIASRSPLEFGSAELRSAAFAGTYPVGFEGLLTLNSGSLRGAFDGDFRLNQSRAFSFGGGDIAFWSSNGDLNAGQGPRSASNFPPVTLRFNNDGLGEVNSIGSVSGAGIGAFKRNPGEADSSIVLVAPVGEVDAGDAGVRASGSIFVAAARVANADNFSAGGSISGVPSGAATAAPALPTGANSTQQAAQQAAQSGNSGDRRSVINVDVLGAVDPCAADPRDPNCVKPPTRP